MPKKRIQRGISQRSAVARAADRNSCRGPKRTHDEALRDRATLAGMDIFNTSQAELARQLNALRPYNVTQQTISRDLQIIRDDYLRMKFLHITNPEEFERKSKNFQFLALWARANGQGI
jgi:hypothetical protein